MIIGIVDNTSVIQLIPGNRQDLSTIIPGHSNWTIHRQHCAYV